MKVEAVNPSKPTFCWVKWVNKRSLSKSKNIGTVEAIKYFLLQLYWTGF